MSFRSLINRLLVISIILFAVAPTSHSQATNFNNLTAFAIIPMSIKDDYSQPWHTLIKSELLNISVERILYEQATNNRIFFHIKIENIGNKTIGIDLQDDRFIFYPNQLEFSKEAMRGPINKRRFTAKELSKDEKSALIRSFHNQQLKEILPGQISDYYKAYNGNGREFIETNKATGNFLMVSIDGWINFTDGESVKQLNCNWTVGTDKTFYLGEPSPCLDYYLSTNIFFPLPLKWKLIPDTGYIIDDPFYQKAR